jgi:lipoprotein-anchoring transpeptidase ErfK/SrfK
VIAAAIVVALLVGVGLFLRPSGSDTVQAAPPPPPPTTTTLAPTTTTTTLAPTTTSTTVQAPWHAFEAGLAVVPSVGLYESPDAPAPYDTMSNPTVENAQLTFSVKEHGPDGWLKVAYSRRPNGSTAWIHASDVQVTPVDNRVVIQRQSKMLTVYRGSGDEVLFQAPIGVGVDRTPTPLGDFYIDIVVHLDRSSGVYGPYQLSVSGFSDVLKSFGGGPGQIAIHGTNQPQFIGTKISNGCVRMKNADVTRVAELTTVGSPVSIVDT